MGQDLDEALRTVRELSQALQQKADDLAAERQQTLGFFAYAPQACLLTGENGRITAANLAAVELLGLPLHRIVGRRVTAVVRAPRLAASSFALSDGRGWHVHLAR